MRSKQQAILLRCLLAALPSVMLAQVTMPVSPLTGNPADLVINYYRPSTDYVTLIINSSPGVVANSCYIYLPPTTFYTPSVRLYDTSSGEPTDYQYGDFGWSTTLSVQRLQGES